MTKNTVICLFLVFSYIVFTPIVVSLFGVDPEYNYIRITWGIGGVLVSYILMGSGNDAPQ